MTLAEQYLIIKLRKYQVLSKITLEYVRSIVSHYK